MTTLQTIAEKADHDARLVAGSEGKEVPQYRSLAGGLILATAVLATLIAGGWGVISSLAIEAPPARIGETVEVPGGLLRVEKVTPEKQMSGAEPAASDSSGEKMEMAPEGSRRFNVDVTLASRESGGLDYSAEDFRLTGEGVKESGPVRTRLDAGTLPEGSAVSGGLVFQAPEKARDLTLSFDGGRPVALDLEPMKPMKEGKNASGGGH